LYLILHC